MVMLKSISRYVLGLIIIVLASLFFLFFTSSNNFTKALSGSSAPRCSDFGISTTIANGPTYIVWGNSKLLKASVLTTTVDVLGAEFFANDLPIGPGQPSTSNNLTWTHPNFDSYMLPNGSYDYYAVFQLGAGSTVPECKTAKIELLVDNDTATTDPPATAELSDIKLIATTGLEWTGPPNTQKFFEVKVKAIYNDNTAVYVTPSANIQWELDGVGSIIGGNVGPNLTYWSGGTPGEASLRVTASFESRTRTIDIDVFVESSNNTGTTYPDSSTGSALDPTDDNYLKELEALEEEAQESGTSKTTTTPGDPVLESCIAKILGTERYLQLTKDGIRLKLAELEKVYVCFSTTQFIIPANVTPVEAKKEVVEQIEKRAEKINFAEVAEYKAEDANESTGLVFKGTAEPEQQILIYVFSEPLVLSTVADANGNWEYVLENPLEPGDHEAYVVVEEEDGDFSRTEAYTFSVASVPISAANPNGLSLSLADSENGLMLYLVISTSLVIAAGAVVYATLKTRKLQKKVDQLTPQTGQVGMGSLTNTPVPNHPKEVAMQESTPEPTPPVSPVEAKAEEPATPSVSSSDEITK